MPRVPRPRLAFAIQLLLFRTVVPTKARPCPVFCGHYTLVWSTLFFCRNAYKTPRLDTFHGHYTAVVPTKTRRYHSFRGHYHPDHSELEAWLVWLPALLGASAPRAR